MARDKELRVRLPDSEYVAVHNIATQYDLPMTSVVLRILQHFLDSDEMMLKYFRRARGAQNTKTISQVIEPEKDPNNKDIAPNCVVSSAARLDKNVRAFMEGESERSPDFFFDVFTSSEVKMSFKGGKEFKASARNSEDFQKAKLAAYKDYIVPLVHKLNSAVNRDNAIKLKTEQDTLVLKDDYDDAEPVMYPANIIYYLESVYGGALICEDENILREMRLEGVFTLEFYNTLIALDSEAN